jgi:glutathione synthase/RimK-type ligase-like ATP-grasp enzyme
LILLCGIPTESPLALVATALEDLDAPYVVFNQRSFARSSLEFSLRNGNITGVLVLEGREFPLEGFSGVYNRLMDDQSLPEVRDLHLDHPDRVRCRRFHAVLLQWMEIWPGRLINRMAAMASNSSKPYQMQLIRQHGFAIPETLITNDPELVREFYRQHGQVIYKSASGVRSIVTQLGAQDFARLERIRWCPTMFQKQVLGENLRVHVIGEQVFATHIQTGAVDYRYAGRRGNWAKLQAVELDDGLARRCVDLTRSLGLAFAGIDLMLTDEPVSGTAEAGCNGGRVYCFEVNPNPGFSYFEAHTGQPIAKGVAHYLLGG